MDTDKRQTTSELIRVRPWLKNLFKQVFGLATVLFCTANFLLAAETNSIRAVVPATAESRLVDTNTLRQIYGVVKTPFKYGVVLRGETTNELVDCPSVFRSGGHWYMLFVAIANKTG